MGRIISLSQKEKKFDLELLKASNEERVNFFKEYTFVHPKFLEVKNQAIDEISSGNYNVIMIIGPSRVGKSRLVNEIIAEIEGSMKEEMYLNRGIIPIAGMELPNPDLRKFNWKDFYYRVLTELQEPMLDNKVDIENTIIGKKAKENINPTNSGTAPELRRSIEKAFKNRETKAFLIDEAQHFFSIGGGSTALETQFNSIKSLSNMAGTRFVMFGTYHLNPVINLDGQLSSRVLEIHFPRYDYRKKEDKKQFRSAVYSLQKVIPLEEEPNLIEHKKYLYEYSIGCIGLLKQWLERCLTDALNSGDKTITLEHLRRNALSIKKIRTLINEAYFGEQQFLEREEEQKEVKTFLFGTKEEIEGITKDENENQNKNNNTKRLKPGQRKPHRDQVGI